MAILVEIFKYKCCRQAIQMKSQVVGMQLELTVQQLDVSLVMRDKHTPSLNITDRRQMQWSYVEGVVEGFQI